jgi:hypothetical protein
MSDKYNGFTRDELLAAFDGVKDVNHWKNPINSVCRAENVEVTKSAIVFFTGTEAEVKNLNDGWYKVTAPGYYLGPCN